MKTHKNASGRALEDYLYAKAWKKRIPLGGTFELSPVCNFSCKMCYVRKTQQEVRANDRKMELNDWLRVAKEAKEAGLLYLLLTGGEPLLWTDFWTLYDELIKMGFILSINTNASLLDENAIRRFKERPPRKINITLYGANDETYHRLCGVQGVFSKVDRAINELKEIGIIVKLNCSLTPDNKEDLEEIIDYAKVRDIELAVATYMFPPIRRDATQIGVNERFTPDECAEYQLRYIRNNRGESGYQKYLEKLSKGTATPPGLEVGCVDSGDGTIKCRAGKATFWVTWDGWITPCGMLPEPKVDLKKKKFGTAWTELTEIIDHLCLSGTCKKCPNENICHPCAAIAYAETGRWSGTPTYRCHTISKMIKNANDILNKNSGGIK